MCIMLYMYNTGDNAFIHLSICSVGYHALAMGEQREYNCEDAAKD